MAVKRNYWIDNVKVIACILVVLGHFYQSIVASGIVGDTTFYRWFDTTIYFFHVPLFFICSGYLFQKYSKIDNFSQWKANVAKKLLALGVPYVFFSIITWVLKKIFSSEVNSQLGGLIDTLINHPASPYWYLYVLFIIFFITITTKSSKQQIVLLFIGVFLKILKCFSIAIGVYFIDRVMDNWIWFILGMTLTYDWFKLQKAFVGTCMFIVFLIGSVLVQVGMIGGRFVSFILALLACYSIISIVYSVYNDKPQNKYWGFFAQYTMPVFLMHTIFAATFRSVLFKVGITNAIVHVIAGVAISFVGPILAMVILEKLRPLDFIVYPTRYIRIGKRS